MDGDILPGKRIETGDLTSVKIGIGDALQLQDSSPGKQRHYVKLIGYLNRKSVLVSHPVQDEKLLAVREGQRFMVRGFSAAKTYEFAASVTGVCQSPYPYLHLSFPDEVLTINMRSALRIRLSLPCSVGSPSAGDGMQATIEDMSVSGARVQARSAFGRVDDEVKVGFRLPVDGAEQAFVVPAIIRNVRDDADNGGGGKLVMHGLEFIQPEGRERSALQNFIYKTIAES
ncbi:MAG: flagellar brake protein [Nitrosomonadales bacterium]|nr:flagellar brake protein [Nitrosomonadales bacterium]